jgi:hypothetical protein
MTAIGKTMVIVGAGLVVIGALVWLLGRLGFRGMPGDIRYESEDVRLYVPIVTCLVLSALLTGLLWLWQWFGRR